MRRLLVIAILLCASAAHAQQFRMPDQRVGGRNTGIPGFNNALVVVSNAVTLTAQCQAAGCTDIENLSSVPTSGTLAITTPPASIMTAGEVLLVNIPTSGGAPATVTWTAATGVTLKSVATFDANFGSQCNTSLPATGLTYYQMYWDGTNLTLTSCSVTSPATSLSTANGGTGVTTAPGSGQLPIGQSNGTYAPTTVGTDGTITNAGVLTITNLSHVTNGSLQSSGIAGSVGGGIGGGGTSVPGPDGAVNVKNYGAKADMLQFAAGAMGSGGTTLTDSTNNPFLSTDCNTGGSCTGPSNKLICVDGASASADPGGVNKNPLCGTITNYISASQVTVSFTNGAGAISGKYYRYGTNDTTADTNAISGACTTNGGGLVWIPGPSAINNTLTLPTNCTIQLVCNNANGAFNDAGNQPAKSGAGLFLLTESLSATAPALLYSGGVAGTTISAENDTIQNCLISASVGKHYHGGGGDGIDMLNWYNLTLVNTEVSNFKGNALYQDTLGNSSADYAGGLILINTSFNQSGTGMTIGGRTGGSGFIQNDYLNSPTIQLNFTNGLVISGSTAAYTTLAHMIVDNAHIQRNDVANSTSNEDINVYDANCDGCIFRGYFESDQTNEKIYSAFYDGGGGQAPSMENSYLKAPGTDFYLGNNATNFAQLAHFTDNDIVQGTCFAFNGVKLMQFRNNYCAGGGSGITNGNPNTDVVDIIGSTVNTVINHCTASACTNP